MTVFEDYSVKLCLQDLSFSAASSQDKIIKMQLLERTDKKKWFVWVAQGKVGRDNIQAKVYPYFNKVDAITYFEKYFNMKTDNKWTEKEFFRA